MRDFLHFLEAFAVILPVLFGAGYCVVRWEEEIDSVGNKFVAFARRGKRVRS